MNHEGHYMGGMGLVFIPILVRCPLGFLGSSGIMTSTSWTPIDTLNSLIGRCNPPPAVHLSLPSSVLPAHLFIHAVSDITAAEKKVTQNPAVLAS